MVADKDFQNEDEIIDLTELIESGRPGAEEDPAVTLSDSDTDFDAILKEAEDGDGRQHSSSVPVDPDEQLDMSAMNDIDNLLESLDIPEQPRSAPASVKSAPPPADASAADLGFSDLDSVLDDLLGPADGSRPTPPPPRPAVEQTDQTGAAAGIHTKVETLSPEADASQKAQDAMNLDADLDSILAEMEPTAPAPGVPPRAAAEQENFDLPPDLDEMLEATAESKPVSSNDFDLPPDLDALMDEPAESETTIPEDMQSHMVIQQRAASPAAPIPPADLADASSAYPPEIVAGVCRSILGSQVLGTQDALQDFARQIGAQTAHIEDLTRQVSELGKRLIACETKLSSARARIAALEKNLAESASLEDILKDGTPLHTGFKSIIASAVGNALQGIPALTADDGKIRQELAALHEEGTTSASRLEKLEDQVRALGQDATNSDLEEKILALETDSAASADRLEELAEQMRNLGQRDANSDLEEKISILESESAAGAEQLSDVASRLNGLEDGLDEKMEKLAANAVARILHEEIARLMAGE